MEKIASDQGEGRWTSSVVGWGGWDTLGTIKHSLFHTSVDPSWISYLPPPHISTNPATWINNHRTPTRPPIPQVGHRGCCHCLNSTSHRRRLLQEAFHLAGSLGGERLFLSGRAIGGSRVKKQGDGAGAMHRQQVQKVR